MTTSFATRPAAAPATPEQRMLTAALLVAPTLYLATDTTYAARGWDDPAAGVLEVLAALGYGLVFLRVASWLPADAFLRAAVVLTGLVGSAGAVVYGFEAIHVSLGDTALVDQAGAATLIKPVGLFFPLALVLTALVLLRTAARWQAALVLVGGLVWPVAHIGDLAPLAVAGNVLLVLGLASLVWRRAGDSNAGRQVHRVRHGADR